jgi:ABC-2 type transport system ATP-binding protein
VTVFVTTHYLDEAEYCNELRLMHAGRIVAGGSPRELKEQHIRTPMLEVECDRIIESLEILQKEAWVKNISVFGAYLHVSVEDEVEGRRHIERIAGISGILIRRIDRIMPSLEDVFLHLIEEKAEQPTGTGKEIRPQGR